MCNCFSNSEKFRTSSQVSRRAIIGSLACLAIAPTATAVRSQDGLKQLLAGACNFYPDDVVPTNVSSFSSSSDAQAIIKRITSAAGLKPNFEIISFNVPNAAAVIQNGIRYILYNPTFITDITSKTGSEWGSWTIMAHEVGHHLNGHTLQPGGSKPLTELEADEFAGFAVNKIGGTLDQALSPYKTMSPAGSSTHPARDARLAAVTSGWNSAAGASSGAKIPKAGSVPPPVANARDMITVIVSSLQSGQTPPFPMISTLKTNYDAQAPLIGPQLSAMGSLSSLLEVKPTVKNADTTWYEYQSNFSSGKNAYWRIGVAENGVINGLWLSATLFP